MAEKLINGADIPKRIVEPYKKMILGLRAKGQTRNLPDLKYKGNSFYLDYKKGDKAFANNWSPKNRASKYATDANRRASTNNQVISRQDYRDFAAKNGYSRSKADQIFRNNQRILREFHKTKGILHYEHFIPTTSQTYGGVEHPRNIGHLNGSANGSKGDKMMSIEDARKLKIPLSKQSAMQKDFNDVPIENKDVQMKNVVKATSKPGLPTARAKNGAKTKAQSRRQALRAGPRSGPINTSTSVNTGGGIPSIVPEVGTMQGGGYRIDADPFGFGTSFMIP